MKRLQSTLAGIAAATLAGCGGHWDAANVGPTPGLRLEQRDKWAYVRGPYNYAFYYRHNDAYRMSAAIHFAHGRAHDVPQLTPLEEAARYDTMANGQFVQWGTNPPRQEPHMMQWGPHTGQFAWNVYRAIDWTHQHHTQTYDIMSDKDIPWSMKQEWTDRSVAFYLKNPIARSPAPLDVTMRRAGVMMKPYFSYFRNNYPKSNNYFYLAHWWHPVIYEAQMIGGNDAEQDEAVRQTHALTFPTVNEDRPLRMLLSREAMPRYSRMSPESGNIFDNLHMLHGIVYDILSYEGWTEAEKRAELYRIVEAMSYQPGDEELTRQFPIPHPDMDPRVYEPWMKSYEGEMSRIMKEMHEEMMPLMMPEGREMTQEMRQRMQDQMRMKLTPGLEDGEHPGSLHDAMMSIMPDMEMTPEMKEGLKPGKTPQKMIEATLAGWHEKYGDMEPAPPIDMTSDPSLPPRPTSPEGKVASR